MQFKISELTNMEAASKFKYWWIYRISQLSYLIETCSTIINTCFISWRSLSRLTPRLFADIEGLIFTCPTLIATFFELCESLGRCEPNQFGLRQIHFQPVRGHLIINLSNARLNFGCHHPDVSVTTMYLHFIVVCIHMQLTRNHVSEVRRINDKQEWSRDWTLWNSAFQWNRWLQVCKINLKWSISKIDAQPFQSWSQAAVRFLKSGKENALVHLSNAAERSNKHMVVADPELMATAMSLKIVRSAVSVPW